MDHDQHDDTSTDEFDALIRANGRRFALASRVRTWAWRLVHEPAWAQGLLAATSLFGAPGVGACTPTSAQNGVGIMSGSRSGST